MSSNFHGKDYYHRDAEGTEKIIRGNVSFIGLFIEAPPDIRLVCLQHQASH